MTPIPTIISLLRNSDRPASHAKLMDDAAEMLESLQSYLAWREQLLRDATRYFDLGDDDAVAYYKALEKQKLTYKYGENVNPAHIKEPRSVELEEADVNERDAARYRFLRDECGFTVSPLGFSVNQSPTAAECHIEPIRGSVSVWEAGRAILDQVIDHAIETTNHLKEATA